MTNDTVWFLISLFFLIFLINYLLTNLVINIRETIRLQNIIKTKYNTLEDFCINNRLYTLSNWILFPIISYRSLNGCTEISLNSSKITCSENNMLSGDFSPCRQGIIKMASLLN